jgi:hypothetical protein
MKFTAYDFSLYLFADSCYLKTGNSFRAARSLVLSHFAPQIAIRACDKKAAFPLGKGRSWSDFLI